MSGSSNVAYGDRISICCERMNNFLWATSSASSSVTVTDTPLGGKPMLHFDRCIFMVESVTTWTNAAAASPSPPQMNSAAATAAVVDSFVGGSHTPALADGQRNGAVVVDPLMFGSVVHLRHVYSGHVVSVTRVRHASVKGGLHVALEPLTPDNVASSTFRVMPRYKIRQEGERVSSGDHLVLLNDYLKVHLALHTAGQELVASSSLESFSFNVFESVEARLPMHIRLQNAVLLFHKEQESFFQLTNTAPATAASPKLQPTLVHPHIRDSTYNIAALDFSSNALWVLEGPLGTEGGLVAASEGYRIRHSAFGDYLAASPGDRESLALVRMPSEGDGTLWYLVPCDINERVVQSSSTFFRVQNVSTGLWLHTATPPAVASDAALALPAVRSPTTTQHMSTRQSCRSAAAYSGRETPSVNSAAQEQSISGFLSLVDRPAYVDVFCAVSAPYETERNLHRVLGFSQLLRSLRTVAGIGRRAVAALSVEQQRAALQEALQDSVWRRTRHCLHDEMVPFCLSSAARGGGGGATAAAPRDLSAAWNVVGKANQSNQRMLFEQGIHSLVVEILELILRWPVWSEFSEVVNTAHLLFVALCAMIKDHPRACLEHSHSVHLLLPYLKVLPIACSVFSELSLMGVMDEMLVPTIVAEVVPLMGQHEAYMNMLQELCFSASVPCAKSQADILTAVLESGCAPVVQQSAGPSGDIDIWLCSSAAGGAEGVQPIAAARLEHQPGVAALCAGWWSLLACCTLGQRYPARAWLELDLVTPLLKAPLPLAPLRAVVAVARSVFLSDVDDVLQHHRQLWSWTYRTNDTKLIQMSESQESILSECIQLLTDHLTDFHTDTNKCELLNELLKLWNSAVMSGYYHQSSVLPPLGEFFGRFMVTVPPLEVIEDKEHVMTVVLHVLNLIQSLLSDHTSKVAKDVRNLIRPQLHEDADEDLDALVAEVRSKSHHDTLCNRQWLPKLLEFASSTNTTVSTAALSCLFNVLSPSRLALHHLESSVVFSEGYERPLGQLLDSALECANMRFVNSRTHRFAAVLTDVLAQLPQFATEPNTNLDAQNVLHFARVHSSICRFLDDAQRASAGDAVSHVVELGMELMSFMTLRNSDVAADMVNHLASLTQWSSVCQSCKPYYTVLKASFAAVREDTIVDVAKLVHDIITAEQLNEEALEVVLEAVRCASMAVRSKTRDACVAAMTVINFESVELACKIMLLEIIAECADVDDTADVLVRTISVDDVASVVPSAKDIITSTECRHMFEIAGRCFNLLFVREGYTLSAEEVDVLKKSLVDRAIEITSAGQIASALPPVVVGCLASMTKIDAFRSPCASAMRVVASHLVNHCETSVNNKFQLDARDELLDFFDSIPEFIRPDVLPNIVAVRRRLQKIVKHTESAKDGASASTIAGHWARIRQELTCRLQEPPEVDLKPLIALLATGTQAGRDTIRMMVSRLHHTELPPWVSVSLLCCLQYLLEEAEQRGEPELIAAQLRLNEAGATPLLSTLIEKPDVAVVRHAIKFGISLLQGGNKQCQDVLLRYFKTHDEKFFLTIKKFLKLAQVEICSRAPSRDRAHHEPQEGSYTAMAQDLCRMLQLLCEGHHFEFQNYVRHQSDNFNTYNILILTMELLHTLVHNMDSSLVQVIVQALNTLTEFCQGPCQQNQADIVGCNAVLEVNRLLTMSYDDATFDDESVMEMKKSAILLLLSLLEGSQDSSIPNLLLTNIDTSALHKLLEHIWSEASEGGDARSADREELLDLGFNIFILAKILISNGDKGKAENLTMILRDTAGYDYFNSSICNIEIWRDDDPTSLRLETVYFRKPEICRLREETKESVMSHVDRSSLVSKHSDFCKSADALIFEMEYQFQIEEAARNLSTWIRYLTFNLGTCRPRPVEDLLLLLSLATNLMVVSGFTTRAGPINWYAAGAFFALGISQFLCSLYLVAVRFILKLPRIAHRAVAKGEVDTFLQLKSWREKFAHVATLPRIMEVLREGYTVAFTTFAVASLLGALVSPYFFTFLLCLVMFKAPLLANIVRAITMNGRQLLLTAFLGVISVYFFTVIGFLFFYEHFERSEGGSNCETLLQCFFYSFGQGVRGGGGIGEELKPNLWENADFLKRELYDTLFFVIIAVIVMNIVFALIVDTFAELRDARKKVEDDMRTTCFVCGIDAATFDREGEGFGPHTKGPHNVWQYLYFLHHLRRKEVCEYTGQESYVASKVNRLDLTFFPNNQSKSLLKSQRNPEPEGASSGSSAPPFTLDDVKKAVKDIVDEQLRPLRAAASASGQNPQASSRAQALWGKARTQRTSLLSKSLAIQNSFVAPPLEATITHDASVASAPPPPPPAAEGGAAQTVLATSSKVDDQEFTLMPSIQAVANLRSAVAAISKSLEAV